MMSLTSGFIAYQFILIFLLTILIIRLMNEILPNYLNINVTE